MKKPLLKLQQGTSISLTVHGLGSHGEGIATVDGFTVFIEGGLPQEKILARIIEIKKNYAIAKLENILQMSPFRIKPPCPFFGTCGGCQIMHLDYAKQLEMKRQRVIDALQRIGKISNSHVHSCIASPLCFGYRNKIQLPVKNGPHELEIGLFAKSSHNLIQIDACLVHSELGEKVYQQIQTFLKKSPLKAYDPHTKQGELRHILIKSAFQTAQVLVVFITNRPATKNLRLLSKQLIQLEQVKGIIHNLHQQKHNVILGKKFETLDGKDHIQEQLLGLTFSISAASFFQVNPLQAENLYKQAISLSEVGSKDLVVDAYCGVGTMSLLFAQYAKKVIGIESVGQAIRDAKKNAADNSIENVSFFEGLAEKHPHLLQKADILIMNPPRKGCDFAFLQAIIQYRPQRLIYVSCDPATLARDLAILQEGKYFIKEVQPLDMFPQTAHVECVAKLESN